MRQALKPRGVFGVYDVMRDGEGGLAYPVRWAAGPETSFVESSAYQSEQLTREAALDAALWHRGRTNMGHRVRVEKPARVVTQAVGR